MRLSRTISLPLAAGAIAIAAVAAAAVVYAQNPPTPLQPAQPPQAATPSKKPTPPAKAQKSNESAPPAAAQGTPPAAGQGAVAAQITTFDEQARQGKITTCANVFGVLGRGVVADSPYTAQTRWAQDSANTHSIQSLVAMSGTGNFAAQRAAGVIFAAPVGPKCEGTLVRITPMNDNCQAVAAELAKQNGRSNVIGDLGLVDLPNGAQVILVPFSNACIAVTALLASG